MSTTKRTVLVTGLKSLGFNIPTALSVPNKATTVKL